MNTETPVRQLVQMPPSVGNIDPSTLDISGDFAVIDTETTGIDPAVDQIIEIAVARRRDGKMEYFHSLVNPGFPIPPTASAVNHIVDEDVATSPSIDGLLPQLLQVIEGAVPVAHNAGFDCRFVDPLFGLNPDPSQWLCTFRASRHLMPLAPAHGNQTLRYWLKTKPRSEGLGPHRAIDDVHVTIETLYHQMKAAQGHGIRNIAELRDLANEVIYSSVVPFGTHAGKPFSEVPVSYFEWALNNLKDLDLDLRASYVREIELRRSHDSAQGYGPRTVNMPFGEHKGKPVAHVPLDYLEQLWKSGKLWGDLREAVGSELEARNPATKASGSKPRAPSRPDSQFTAAAAPSGPKRGMLFAAQQSTDSDAMEGPTVPEPQTAVPPSPAPRARSARP